MFAVTYIITVFEDETIGEKVEWICLEQSVELPEDVVPDGLLQKITGKPELIEARDAYSWKVVIKWPVENAGASAIQFLNILFGNISLRRGIKIVHVEWDALAHIVTGPQFGIQGIRERLGISDRALSCGVLKPMGSSPQKLAEQAFELAMGGIDIIKDDHGLANQNYAPFKARVEAVTAALSKAERKKGVRAAYFPNITDAPITMQENFGFAHGCGADGVMILPHLCGFESMRLISVQPEKLPIIAHPAYSGMFVTDNTHGYSPEFLYGELTRAFGADFTIYPNTGGRFSFSLETCMAINDAAQSKASPFKTVMSMPGGGVNRKSIPTWVHQYGKDIAFLLGASLARHPQGLRKGAEEVRQMLEKGA